GVGTIREAEVGGTRWVEELIAWEADLRWAYTVTRASVPIAWAQVESFELEACGGATRVTWTLACEPRLLMRLRAAAPAAGRRGGAGVLGRRRARRGEPGRLSQLAQRDAGRPGPPCRWGERITVRPAGRAGGATSR